jgi:hypothetical protein
VEVRLLATHSLTRNVVSLIVTNVQSTRNVSKLPLRFPKRLFRGFRSFSLDIFHVLDHVSGWRHPRPFGTCSCVAFTAAVGILDLRYEDQTYYPRLHNRQSMVAYWSMQVVSVFSCFSK